jgi:hypothetical protein
MSGDDRSGELARALDDHRNELQRLPGVVGTGVGIPTAADRPPHPVIQVFVRSPEDVEDVRRWVQRILHETPAEVVVTGEVSAAQAEGEGESHGQT